LNNNTHAHTRNGDLPTAQSTTALAGEKSLLQVGGEKKEDPYRCLSRSNWKIATSVTDTMQQSEELEEMSRKLMVRIRHTKTYLEAATSILADLEQDYECLKALLGDATVDMERVQSETSQAGDRLQSFEKVSDEYTVF